MSLSMGAQGRGNAYAAAILLVIAGLQSCSLLASAATYTVGDSSWDLGIDYTTWAAAHTFKVGDILFFPYSQGQHDVVVVNKAGYDACSTTNAIATFSEGNTNVTLSSTGVHYYFCSVISHCAGGMKIAVTVTAAAAPPTATTAPPTAATAPPTATTTPPTASPPATPSKTPSSPPAPSSTSTPSSAPSPSSPAPAPAPSAEAPASAPTPSSPASTPTMGPSSSTPSAPGSTPSSTGTPVSSPPPPNAAPSPLASASIGLLLALWVALFV